MEEQKNIILLGNLSCYLMRYNYRIISRYNKNGFYSVEIIRFTENERHSVCGCHSKNFDNLLLFVLTKIQKIIENK